MIKIELDDKVAVDLYTFVNYVYKRGWASYDDRDVEIALDIFHDALQEAIEGLDDE